MCSRGGEEQLKTTVTMERQREETSQNKNCLNHTKCSRYMVREMTTVYEQQINGEGNDDSLRAADKW